MSLVRDVKDIMEDTDFEPDPYDGSSKEACRKAKLEGLDIIESNPRLLILDIDSTQDLDFCRKQLIKFRYFLAIEKIEFNVSRSQHFHIKVHLTKDIEDEKLRIMYQSLLGSDRVKEFLSILRLNTLDLPASVLFSTKNPWMELKF